MDNSFFSLITICFNSSATIERTIKSVLAQTFTDYEYIIVDGGSTDSTLDIVKKYEPLFEGRMKWKSEPDKGIYDAMNKGIKRSSGTIIGIVNSDDWLEPDALKVTYNTFLNNGKDKNSLYCGGINYVMPNKVKKWEVNIESFKKQVSLYVMSGIRHPGLFVPKEVYDKVGIYNDNLRLSADQDFVLRCYFHGVRFYDIKKIVSNMAEGGLSTSGSAKAWQMSVEDRKKMLKGFGIYGFKFYWLMYSWYIRNWLRKFFVKILLYK